MSGRYTVKPKADQDLDNYPDYLAREATTEIALRFLAEAHETFSLITAHPNIGWPARLKHLQLEALRVFRVSGFERMLILYRPLPAAWTFCEWFTGRVIFSRYYGGALKLSDKRGGQRIPVPCFGTLEDLRGFASSSQR